MLEDVSGGLGFINDALSSKADLINDALADKAALKGGFITDKVGLVSDAALADALAASATDKSVI